MPGRPVCREMSRRLAPAEEWAAFAAGHRSVRLAPDQVDSARMILTASPIERSAVAVLRPGARDRCFTLREAAALAEHAVNQGIDLRDCSIEDVAAVLNAQRGKIEIPRARGHAWWSRRPDRDAFTIEDPHTSGAHHPAVLAAIVDGSERLGRALSHR